MTDTYNAYQHLYKLKQQSTAMQYLLCRHNYNNYEKINIKLESCSKASKVVNNRINQNHQSCDSPVCPICASAHKIRKQCAISYAVFDEIKQGIVLGNGRIDNPIMKLLTLTVPKVPIHLFTQTFKKLREDLKVFIEYQMRKTPKKLVTFDQSLLGYSVYYHVSLTNDYSGNQVVGIHLHSILLLKPSFNGANSITKGMVSDGWSEVVGLNQNLETNIKSIKPTPVDFVRTVAYGLAKYDFDKAIANPHKYIQLLPLITGRKFQTHFDCMSTLRTKVQKHHKSKQNFYKAKTILTTMHNIKDQFYVVS